MNWLRRKMGGSCHGLAWFLAGSFWASAFHHYNKTGWGPEAQAVGAADGHIPEVEAMSDDQGYDYYDDNPPPEGHVMCPRCDGHSTVSCHCGGDLCVCDNDGEKPCPFCGGEYGGEGYVPKDERYERYIQREAEIHAAFRKAMQEEKT